MKQNKRPTSVQNSLPPTSPRDITGRTGGRKTSSIFWKNFWIDYRLHYFQTRTHVSNTIYLAKGL